MDKKEKSNEKIGILLSVTTAIIWGYAFVATKDLAINTPILILVTARTLVGAILLHIIFFKRMKGITKNDIILGMPIGVCLFATYTLQGLSLEVMEASKMSFYAGGNIIFVPFLIWLFTKKRPATRYFIASFVGFIGVALLTFGSFSGVKLIDMLAVASSILFATNIVLVDIFVKKADSVRLTVTQMYFAAITALIFSLLNGEKLDFSFTLGDGRFSFFYLAFFSTSLGYLLKSIGQKYINTSKSSLILSLSSFFGAIFGVIFLGENVTKNIIFSGMFIFLAILISNANIEARTKIKFALKKCIKRV